MSCHEEAVAYRRSLSQPCSAHYASMTLLLSEASSAACTFCRLLQPADPRLLWTPTSGSCYAVQGCMLYPTIIDAVTCRSGKM